MEKEYKRKIHILTKHRNEESRDFLDSLKSNIESKQLALEKFPNHEGYIVTAVYMIIICLSIINWYNVF